MGHRLSRIATRTGDDGTTGLADGSRRPKDDRRVAALGEVDELNSVLGLLLTEDLPEELRNALTDIQHDLFDLGGELAIPGFENVDDSQVARLDALLEQHNAALPRLAEFVLPGGSRAAAYAPLARPVCRRAERALVALGRDEPVRPACRQYINRLSDLMFVLARVLNRHAGRGDVLWQQGKNKAAGA
ncbi:MAG: cob(I)yrinic acid a,c-diamide adenosyltransferase [Burkholderiales bacterium]|nr:MAG: cob(I)yrinic acid a,c-diamide adenosyltransferase [Burkholderiales bacterium]